MVEQLSRATRALVGRTAVSTRHPARLGPLPEGPLGRPALPGNSGLYPRPRGVDQMSQATWARIRGPRGVDQLYRVTWALVRGPPVSTSGPGRLGPGSEDTKSTSCPGELGAVSDIPRTRPAVPGGSGPGRTYCGFYQASWATGARSRGPAVWTSCPGQHGTVPEGSQRRPDIPGVSGPCPRAQGVDQLPRVTWARDPEPAVSSSSPG